MKSAQSASVNYNTLQCASRRELLLACRALLEFLSDSFERSKMLKSQSGLAIRLHCVVRTHDTYRAKSNWSVFVGGGCVWRGGVVCVCVGGWGGPCGSVGGALVDLLVISVAGLGVCREPWVDISVAASTCSTVLRKLLRPTDPLGGTSLELRTAAEVHLDHLCVKTTEGTYLLTHLDFFDYQADFDVDNVQRRELVNLYGV